MASKSNILPLGTHIMADAAKFANGTEHLEITNVAHEVSRPPPQKVTPLIIFFSFFIGFGACPAHSTRLTPVPSC